jgi:hypothetical protein
LHFPVEKENDLALIALQKKEEKKTYWLVRGTSASTSI